MRFLKDPSFRNKTNYFMYWRWVLCAPPPTHSSSSGNSCISQSSRCITPHLWPDWHTFRCALTWPNTGLGWRRSWNLGISSLEHRWGSLIQFSPWACILVRVQDAVEFLAATTLESPWCGQEISSSQKRLPYCPWRFVGAWNQIHSEPSSDSHEESRELQHTVQTPV